MQHVIALVEDILLTPVLALFLLALYLLPVLEHGRARDVHVYLLEELFLWVVFFGCRLFQVLSVMDSTGVLQVTVIIQWCFFIRLLQLDHG